MIARAIAALEIWIFHQRMKAARFRPCSSCVRHINDSCIYSGEPTHIARRQNHTCGIVGKLWEGKVPRETSDRKD